MTNTISSIYTKSTRWLRDVKDVFTGNDLKKIEINTTIKRYNPIIYKKISSDKRVYYILETKSGGMVIYTTISEESMKYFSNDLQELII